MIASTSDVACCQLYWRYRNQSPWLCRAESRGWRAWCFLVSNRRVSGPTHAIWTALLIPEMCFFIYKKIMKSINWKNSFRSKVPLNCQWSILNSAVNVWKVFSIYQNLNKKRELKKKFHFKVPLRWWKFLKMKVCK